MNFFDILMDSINNDILKAETENNKKTLWFPLKFWPASFPCYTRQQHFILSKHLTPIIYEREASHEFVSLFST